MVLTTEEANIYVLVIPMILLVTVFNDVKFSIQINANGHFESDYDGGRSAHGKIRLSGKR